MTLFCMAFVDGPSNQYLNGLLSLAGSISPAATHKENDPFKNYPNDRNRLANMPENEQRNGRKNGDYGDWLVRRRPGILGKRT